MELVYKNFDEEGSIDNSRSDEWSSKIESQSLAGVLVMVSPEGYVDTMPGYELFGSFGNRKVSLLADETGTVAEIDDNGTKESFKLFAIGEPRKIAEMFDEEDAEVFMQACYDEDAYEICDLLSGMKLSTQNEANEYFSPIKLRVNESMNEAKAKNPKGLANEFAEIKNLSDEYGLEYLTAMPFTAFDGDPESIEKKYPNFFRVVKSFFKEMGIAYDMNDTDELDDLWDELDSTDWSTIIRTCEILTKGGSAQIEKIYKTEFKGDGLVGESINEEDEEDFTYAADLKPGHYKVNFRIKAEFVDRDEAEYAMDNNERYSDRGFYLEYGWNGRPVVIIPKGCVIELETVDDDEAIFHIKELSTNVKVPGDEELEVTKVMNEDDEFDGERGPWDK